LRVILEGGLGSGLVGRVDVEGGVGDEGEGEMGWSVGLWSKESRHP
jgi:hypothetical protein